MTRPYLEGPGPIAIAHRGGGAEAPENTQASFAHAISLGYRYLETDVHATADGVVVVCHDPSLQRTAGRPGLIRELPWREVATAVLAGGERIPRLDDLLGAWPDARWNIDAKDGTVVGPLVDVLHRARALDRVCVSSFSERRLAELRRRLGPDLCTALGPLAIVGLRVASLLPDPRVLSWAWHGASAAQVPVRSRGIPVTDRRFVAAAHRAGVAVHVWTIDDEAAMEELIDLGVDGIMTDRPTVLRSVLERRGLWR